MRADVVIVGAGLSGLHAASLLKQRGADALLIEASPRIGGRALAWEVNGARFDMGPAWVWPHQRHVLAALRAHGVETFEQHSDGRLVYQDERGRVRRDLEFSTMAGSIRVVGGLQTLAERVCATLDPERVWLGARLEGLTAHAHSVEARLSDGRTVSAAQVVLALPPRLAARITWAPALPEATLARLRAVPTWMAGHAKAVAVYDRPFWRDRGLSGDAISRIGPLGEIHDASPHDHTSGALFGFFGRSAAWRDAHRAALEDHVRDQLRALFGERAGTPHALRVVDWAMEPLLATQADANPPREHPHYAPIGTLGGPWDARVIMAGAEVAAREGGYVEGALIAAEAACARLDKAE